MYVYVYVCVDVHVNAYVHVYVYEYVYVYVQVHVYVYLETPCMYDTLVIQMGIHMKYVDDTWCGIVTEIKTNVSSRFFRKKLF